MCLYLTEPMTIDEARNMRNRLNYYDRVLEDIQTASSPNAIIEMPNDFDSDMITKEDIQVI